MSFMIDKEYQVLISSVTSTTASGLPGVEQDERFSVQVNPTITGSPTYTAAIIQASNDGANWFTATTTAGTVSGTLSNGVPQMFEVKDGTAAEYRLKIHNQTSGGVTCTAYVTGKRLLN